MLFYLFFLIFVELFYAKVHSPVNAQLLLSLSKVVVRTAGALSCAHEILQSHAITEGLLLFNWSSLKLRIQFKPPSFYFVFLVVI
jgi:hypothetical protein